MFGQLPLGELLSVRSATRLEGIAACLIDCSDSERVARLGPRRLPAAVVDDLVAWGAWMRGHGVDPQYRQDVIVDASDATMTLGALDRLDRPPPAGTRP